MKDLTEAELEELADELTTFTQDMALIGLVAVVIVEGRGISRLAYPGHVSAQVPQALEHALASVKAHNARKAN